MLLSQHMILLISLWLLFNIVPLGSHATIINNNNINNNDFHTNIINKLIPNPISIPFHHNYNQRTTPPFRPVHQRSFTESFQNNEYSFTFYVDTFNPIHEQQHCGSFPSQACPSLLKAFQQLNDQLELRNISMSIPSNLTSNISVQFYIMNDEFNFCFADFMAPPRHTIEYSFKFVGVPNNVTGMYPQVQCSKDLPFNRSDISLLDFSFLNAQTLYIFSCTPIEMHFTNCNIVNSVFLLAQFVESIQQVYRDVCGSASADSQMSTMDSFKSLTFSHSLTFQNVTIENTLVMCSFMKTITLSNVIQKQLMTTFSFENSEKVEMIDYVVHDGLFCKITNVESVRIDRMIYVAQRFTFFMRGVIQLFVSNSQFLSYIMLDAGLFSLERLDHVQIKNCRVNGFQYTWLHCRDVTSLELENLQVTNNRVQSTVSSTLNIITIEDLISFSLKHSYFDSNYGLHGNDLLIHSHANIHIYNNTFRNGWSFTRGGSCSLGMSKSQYVFGGSMTNITGNMFENNYCQDVGGAIFMTAAYVLILEHNTFINNTARIRGGAVAIDGLIRADLSLTGSRFDNNRVLTNSLIQTNTMGIMGSGGAIYLSSPKCTSLKAYFSNNSALRGGAIFIHQQPNMPDVIPCLIRESIFENNQALNAGGALYFSNIKNVNDLIETKSVKFINNHAKIFGNDMASTIQQFTITELLPKTVYPGQNISISVQATDIFHRWTPLETQLFSLQLINSNQFLLDFSLNGSIITLNLKQVSTENFSTSQNISILPENILLPTWISVHVIPCPQGMIASERGFQGQTVYICVKNDKIDQALLIGIVVPVGIVFLIGGIIIGISIIMCAFYIIKKFKLLQEKERAEKNIEKKIIDKRIIFGMDEEMHDHTENSSLHKPLLGTTSSSYHHHHSPSRHQQKQKPSFIIPIEHIEIEKKVAAGGFGVVYKGKLWNKVDVAIKLLKASDREEMDEEFEKEVSLVSSLRHANIVTFYGICLTSDSKYMVTEFLSKGSLDKIISKSKQGLEPLSLVTKLFILIGTAKGMEYLHGMTPRVIHRDLKPGNILLDSHFEAKICDFGISRTVANTTIAMQSAFTMNLGTLFYMAPELLDPQSEQFMSNMSKQERVDYYTKLDVYSFGIILHEVFFEETPFVSNASKLSPLNSAGTSSSDYSNHCFNIPQLVLQGKRPTIPFSTEEQVLTWIQEYMPLSERKSLRNLPQSILMYFSVVERAWSSQPLSRPTFTEIRKSLEEIYLLIQQDTEL